MTAILIAFWTAVAVILYTFFGFPLLLAGLARLFARPVQKAAVQPRMTLLIPAYNEAAVIAQKIDNSLAQSYPADKFEVVIVADGSTDETVAIAQQYANRGVVTHFEPERRGKATAVNRIMPRLSSDIVVFSDANTMLDANTLAAIAPNFADPDVAAVAGEKQVLDGGEGLYWRYESALKRLDSQLGSVMGAAGELFAVRRQLFAPPEPDSIIEDFVMSMRLVADGWRVVYEPTAVAREAPSSGLNADWQRRTRIAAGGFQSIRRLTPLLDPRRGWVWWQYVSHRVLRWAVTPFLLPLVFGLNLLLLKRPFYQLTAGAQVLFYGAGLVGYFQARNGRSRGLLHTIFFFCLTNLAAIVGFWRYVTHSQPVTWQKVR